VKVTAGNRSGGFTSAGKKWPSIKIAGRWFCERHAEALAISGGLDTLYGFPSGWTDVE